MERSDGKVGRGEVAEGCWPEGRHEGGKEGRQLGCWEGGKEGTMDCRLRTCKYVEKEARQGRQNVRLLPMYQ